MKVPIGTCDLDCLPMNITRTDIANNYIEFNFTANFKAKKCMRCPFGCEKCFGERPHECL